MQFLAHSQLKVKLLAFNKTECECGIFLQIKHQHILMGFYIILKQCIFNYATLSTLLSLSFHIKQNMIH